MLATPLLLSRTVAPARPHYPPREERVLLLVDEAGAAVGGYRNGKELNPEAARAVLNQPGWRVVDGKHNR